MTKSTPIRQANVTLTQMGFVPSPGLKAAGVARKWVHPDGRMAFVSFDLAGKSNLGHSTGCGWRHYVTYTELEA